MPEAVTLRELLRDPIYREWLKKVPELNHTFTQPPWRVFGREEPKGRLMVADFDEYREAYRFVAKNMGDYHDLIINSKGQAFKPPVVSRREEIIVVDEGKRKRVLKKVKSFYVPTPANDVNAIKDQHKHLWCPYCRRPTLFLWYKKHPAMKGYVIDPSDRRCCICGVRLQFIRGVW